MEISSSSSGSGDAVADAGVVTATTTVPVPAPSTITGVLPTKSVSPSASTTCSCFPSGAPRTCFECLNTKLQNGDMCVIHPYGGCISSSLAQTYKSYFDTLYSATTTKNSSITPLGDEFFWSSDATYCLTEDAACSSCRAKWVAQYKSLSLRSNFSCVGAGGCVCTAYCELRAASSIVIPESTPIDQGSCADLSQSGVNGQSIAVVRNIMSLLVGALVVVLTVRQCVSQYHQTRYEGQMRARRRALRERHNETGRFGPMLSLEGWNGYREQLIEREQESLGLKNEPLLTEAPSRIVVEEGEGFRPPSPSQYHQQQQSRQETATQV